jgi:hypothetical protein
MKIFKTQEEKDLEQDIKSITEIMKVLPKDQRKAMINAVIGGRVTVLENTEIVQKKFTTVESDKVTETTEKIQEATKTKKVQPRKTAFFDKDLLKDNELAVKMKMKRNGVEVELIESEAMKKSKDHNDKVMRVKKGFSSDKMVKVLKAELEWFKEKGLHPEPFQASFNQGGESL